MKTFQKIFNVILLNIQNFIYFYFYRLHQICNPKRKKTFIKCNYFVFTLLFHYTKIATTKF